MSPVAGMWNVFMSSTRSGLGMFQPSVKVRGVGASLESPSLAPPSTQATRVAISCWLSERSSAKWPYFGSANQGGIFLVTTSSLMALAQGRASVYDIKAKGAISPARWHSWQCCWRIGATSLWKVTADDGADHAHTAEASRKETDWARFMALL